MPTELEHDLEINLTARTGTVEHIVAYNCKNWTWIPKNF